MGIGDIIKGKKKVKRKKMLVHLKDLIASTGRYSTQNHQGEMRE
jgi:hypothetical protein